MAYDPASMARIRVYKTAPVVRIILGDACSGESHQTIDTSSPGLTILYPNRTLGIPQHDRKPIHRYDEYVIPAGGLITLQYYWQGQHANGTWVRYGPIFLSFTPAAGNDYETWVSFEKGSFQGPELRRVIQAADGEVLLDMPSISNLYHQCR